MRSGVIGRMRDVDIERRQRVGNRVGDRGRALRSCRPRPCREIRPPTADSLSTWTTSISGTSGADGIT